MERRQPLTFFRIGRSGLVEAAAYRFRRAANRRVDDTPESAGDRHFSTMVNRNLIRGLDLGNEEMERELELAMADGGSATTAVEWGGGDLAVNSIVEGRIIRVDDEFVLVDVGYKSEGQIPRTSGTIPKSRRKSASS